MDAAASNGHRLRWNGYTWYEPEQQPQTQKSVDEIIRYDTSRLELVPALFEGLDAKRNDHSGLTLRVTKTFPRKIRAVVEGNSTGDRGATGRGVGLVCRGHRLRTSQAERQEAEIDWFDLRVVLDVSDTTLSAEEIRLLLNAGGFVRLAGKGWRRLKFDLTQEDDERLARLGLSPRELTAEPQRLHALQLADESANKFLPAEQVTRPEAGGGDQGARRARVAARDYRPTPPLPARGLSFPGLPGDQPVRRNPGRRHGPGQNAPNVGLAIVAAEQSFRQQRHPGLALIGQWRSFVAALPGRMPKKRHGQLARRGGALHAGPARTPLARAGTGASAGRNWTVPTCTSSTTANSGFSARAWCRCGGSR